MSTRITDILTRVFDLIFWVLIFVTPLLFLTLTTEFYETPKLIFIIIATSFLLFLWILKSLVLGKVTITHTPLDFPLLILLAVFIVSTFFSHQRWVSILGNFPRWHGTLTSITLYILLYFILVSNIRKIKTIVYGFYLLLMVGVILSLISLSSFIGISILPIGEVQTTNFSPTGSIFSTSALLSLLIPVLILCLFKGGFIENPAQKSLSSVSERSSKTILAFILGLYLTTIVLIGSLASHAVTFMAIFLCLYLSQRAEIKKNLTFITPPLVLALIVALFAYLPLVPKYNLLNSKATSLSREVQLPLVPSWKISMATFADSPLLGSGPGTFLFAFTRYKPTELNSSTFWNIRFDQPFNEYLLMLATVGIAGAAAFIFFGAKFILLAWRKIQSSAHPLGRAVGISGMLFFILLALHPSTLLLWVLGVVLFVSLLVIYKEGSEEIQISIATIKSSDERSNIKTRLLPIFLLIVTLSILPVLYYYLYQFSKADYLHRQALLSISKNNWQEYLRAYNALTKAERLNPFIDVYRTNLAQTNFTLANTIATTKGPSESSPSGSLTDQDKQNITQLLSKSVAAARAATAISPNNPANWAVLSAIYKQLTGVAKDALNLAINAQSQAISKDPMNPDLRVGAGALYLSAKNYDMAIRLFNDAIALKNDYGSAYYNLAIAYRDKGEPTKAITATEKAVSLAQNPSKDYDLASQLLSELKREQTQLEEVAPETVTADVLKGKAIPKSLDKVLKETQGEKVATPPAVQNQ